MNNGGTMIKNVLATVAKSNVRHLATQKIHLLESHVDNQVVRRSRTVQSGKIHEINANCATVIMEKLFVQSDVHPNNVKMGRFWVEVSFI